MLPPSILIKEATKFLKDYRKARVVAVDPVNGGQGQHSR
jgi:hypothetical protein